MKTTPTNDAGEPLVYDHPFERAGLGVAPFSFVKVISFPSKALLEANPESYNREVRALCGEAERLGVSLCMCNYCGMDLLHNFVIRDANGKHAVVGCDCVGKTGDNQLYTVVEAERRRIERERRAAARRAEADARFEAIQGRLEAERDANEGLTVWEAREEALDAGVARRKAALADLNEPFLEVLRTATSGGSFLPSILAELEGGREITDLSPRALDILAEIYARAKSGKSVGSKAGREALSEFWSLLRDAEAAVREATAVQAREATVIIHAWSAAEKREDHSFAAALEESRRLRDEAEAAGKRFR